MFRIVRPNCCKYTVHTAEVKNGSHNRSVTFTHSSVENLQFDILFFLNKQLKKQGQHIIDRIKAAHLLLLVRRFDSLYSGYIHYSYSVYIYVFSV